MWDEYSSGGLLKVVDDRFAKTGAIPWSEFSDDYFAALRRIALPLFALFATPGWLEPETWLTRETVERERLKN